MLTTQLLCLTRSNLQRRPRWWSCELPHSDLLFVATHSCLTCTERKLLHQLVLPLFLFHGDVFFMCLSLQRLLYRTTACRRPRTSCRRRWRTPRSNQRSAAEIVCLVCAILLVLVMSGVWNVSFVWKLVGIKAPISEIFSSDCTNSCWMKHKSSSRNVVAPFF